MESNDIINRIRPYLEKRHEILMGFLFGSYTHGYQCKESDIDIALYLKDTDEKTEIEIQNDVERLLKKHRNSNSSTTLSWNILRKGIPIIIKDRRLFLDFLLNVSTETEDFIEFNLDTWRRKYGTRTNR